MGKVRADKTKQVLHIAKLLFTPVAVVFLIYSGWISRNVIIDVLSDARGEYILLGILVWIGLHFISPLFTVLFLNALQRDLSYADAFYIHASRLPAKYLPGGIWHSVARAYDYHKNELPRSTIGIYLVFENLLTALITITVGGLIVITVNSLETKWSVSIASAATAGILVLLLLPLILRFVKSGNLLYIKIRSYFLSLSCLLVYWSIAGLSFVFYMTAFPGISIDLSNFHIAGIYIFSWGVGFIALFAPQGIGIFEIVSGSLLNAELELIGMVALLAGFRFVVLVADCLAWSVTWFLKPSRSN